MSKFTKRLFEMPECGDAESNVVAKLTNSAALGMLLLGVIFVLAAAFIAPELVRRATILAATFGVASFGIIILIRNHKLQLASTLLISVMWLAVTIGSITAGGVSAPIFVGYLVVILAS